MHMHLTAMHVHTMVVPQAHRVLETPAHMLAIPSQAVPEQASSKVVPEFWDHDLFDLWHR